VCWLPLVLPWRDWRGDCDFFEIRSFVFFSALDNAFWRDLAHTSLVNASVFAGPSIEVLAFNAKDCNGFFHTFFQLLFAKIRYFILAVVEIMFLH
jgi:hypothetical protein